MNASQHHKGWDPTGVATILAIVLLVGALLLLASVPPVSRDALTHHLAIPKLYIEHGGMYEIPHIEFSYYPMNLDLLYAVPLYFGNDIVPKFLHFAFALLTAGSIFTFIRPRLGTNYALGGVIAFLSLPVIVKLSITVYVDLGLVFFSTAALLRLIRWQATGFAMRHLVVAAVFCGLALGTKYNALVTLLLLSLFAPFMYARGLASSPGGNWRAIGCGLLFAGVALLVFSPWMLRNYVWTHNPLYPLFENSLQASGTGATVNMGHFLLRKTVFNEAWWETLAIPLRIFFQGQDGSPRYFDGRLNPYLLALPLFAFSWVPEKMQAQKTGNKILLCFAGLFLLLVFLTRDMRIRYIAPIIPPLVILTMFGLHNLAGRMARVAAKRTRIAATIVLWSVCALFLSFNVAYLGGQFALVKPFGYLSGDLSREAYIETYRPEYAVLRFANQHLPPQARILGLFMGNRSYYSDRIMVFDIDGFKHTLANEPSGAAVAARLGANGISHIIVGYALFNQWIATNLEPESQRRLKAFVEQHLEPLFSSNGYGLYRISS